MYVVGISNLGSVGGGLRRIWLGHVDALTENTLGIQLMNGSPTSSLCVCVSVYGYPHVINNMYSTDYLKIFK